MSRNEMINEDQLIENLARKIVDMKMDSVAIFLLESFGPMGRLWSQIALLYLQPLLILLGSYGNYLLKIFEDPVKVEKLIKRIEELRS
ncbi:MAG: hypothetical protein JHC19_07520 [Desulfurococcaceae archaeon]|nr:hypothetical protein [Desulfurococcaceae archaeon]